MSQQPLTIIGAGLGGLTLSRCLLARGIPNVVYEKASPAPRNGYGITLDSSTYQPLLKVLEVDEKTFRNRVAVDGAIGGNGIINPRKYTGRASASSLRANRAKLEELLREDVDVRWEHAVSAIEASASGGSTTITFKNGEKLTPEYVFGVEARGKDDACYKPNRPLDSATDTPEEFFQEVAELQNLEQPFKEVFDAQKLRKERILSWLMRTMEDVSLADLQGLEEKRIFLMGDSVHAEAILGGAGANVAITDGVELAEHIATKGVGSIAQWYESRYPVWQESLKRSTKAIDDMHEDRKSVL